jgi:hypothetical protein
MKRSPWTEQASAAIETGAPQIQRIFESAQDFRPLNSPQPQIDALDRRAAMFLKREQHLLLIVRGRIRAAGKLKL